MKILILLDSTKRSQKQTLIDPKLRQKYTKKSSIRAKCIVI